MPATAIIVAGVGALIVMCVILAVVFVTAFRSRSPSKLPTAIALAGWITTPVPLGRVWLIVAAAAYHVDNLLTYA